jgi:hypothetical protein
MVDEVARALCRSAGTCLDGERVKEPCVQCDKLPDETRVCNMWPTFRHEARAAIAAAYQWHKKERRWPGFVGK